MGNSMLYLSVWVIFAVTVCSAQSLGFGPKLKCYQCNSLTQPHCGDPFDNRTFILEPCQDNGQNYSRCMKKIVELYHNRQWIRRIERNCAVEGEIGAEEGRWCHTVEGTQRVVARYCYCNNKQGCNSGEMRKLDLLLSLLLSLLFLFFTVIP
uniref:Protein sleepless n=1 Tax=Mesocestoides corti TaxID=53468 RepID=A0A5K3END0_MESCO